MKIHTKDGGTFEIDMPNRRVRMICQPGAIEWIQDRDWVEYESISIPCLGIRTHVSWKRHSEPSTFAETTEIFEATEEDRKFLRDFVQSATTGLREMQGC